MEQNERIEAGDKAEMPAQVALQVRLPVGTIISEPSLVVDLDGRSWWVRPLNMVIVPID